MVLTQTRGYRAALAFLLALMLMVGGFVAAQPAAATHPDGSCLEVEPETDTNPVGTSHTLTASLVNPGPVNPEGVCSSTNAMPAMAPTGGTTVDFDFESGPPVVVEREDGNTVNRSVTPSDQNPSTADATCRIPAGSSTCTIIFRSNTTGTNVIRGFIRGHTPDENEPRNESSEVGTPVMDGDEPDTTDVVEKTWEAPAGTATSLDCSPENEVNATNDTHTITCEARDASGNPVEGEEVDAEATGANDPDDQNGGSPDFTCTTDEDGRCSFTHGPGQAEPNDDTGEEGTTTYRAWIDRDDTNNVNEGDTGEAPGAQEDDDNTDVVTKQWVSAPLNCNPEDDLNPTGTAHTITCSFTNENGDPVAGQRIHAEATGANDPDSSDTPAQPDFTCTTRADDPATPGTDETGTCSFTHGPGGTGTTNNLGTTQYRAWVDDDNNAGTFNGDATEGVDENAQGEEGSTPEGDDTDVVQKRWTASRLDCTPETDTNPAGTSHSVVCNALSEGGANAPGIEIDAEATGANDPDNGNSTNTPDFTCTTGNDGRCTIVHGPGGVGTTNNGGTTTYRAWIDMDRDSATTTGGDDFDENETQIEGTDVTEPDNTDVVSKTWIASRLDCTPEADTNPAESAHTVTCRATDQLGATQSGVIVDVEATEANDPDGTNSPTSPDFTCTTDATGSCSFIHGPGGRGTTDEFGRTLYRAWIDADGNDATAEADPNEGRDETVNPSPSPTGSPSPAPSSPSPSPSGTPSTGSGTRPEPDDTDVVEKNWSAVPTTLTIDPEADTAPVGSCNAFTITATDAAGAPVQFVVVDVEQRHETSDNIPAGDEPTVAFCKPGETDGANPSSVDASRGDLGTGEDGTIGGETEKTTDAQGQVTIGIRVTGDEGSNGSGDVLVTAFYENEDNDDPDQGEPQDSATKTWTPSLARTIDCTPETATNRVGDEHTVTCTVEDVNGEPVAGEGVSFTEDGPGSFTTAQETNTNSQGRAIARVTSEQAGTQSITGTLSGSSPDSADECDKAVGDPEGAPAGQCSDSVEKTWRGGKRVSSGPCEGFSRGTRTDRQNGGQVIVGTNGNDILRGTNGRDIICGLGGKDTLIGRGGDDIVSGGGQNDIARGNAGRDRLLGNGGEDTLAGGADKDTVVGGRGDDVIRAGGGNDVLAGKGGDDVIGGRSGRDTLRGNRGNDSLNGGKGRDDVDGGDGLDSCRSPGEDRVSNCER